MMVLLHVWCVHLAIFSKVVAYNFDVDNVIVYEDATKANSERSSYFGFSVALYANTTGLNRSLIYIGAPRANSTNSTDLVKEPGAVFTCTIGHPCNGWILTTEDAKLKDRYPSNNSWIGATMDIQYNERPEIVVCGPRWSSTNYTSSKNGRRSDVIEGLCYKSSVKNVETDETPEPFAPILDATKPGGHKGQNYNIALFGQAGFSIDMHPDRHETKFMLGCPGVAYGKGISGYYNGTKFGLPYTQESREVYHYYGYALTSGVYSKQYLRFSAMAGPRARNLSGNVYLYTYVNSNRPVAYYGSVTAKNKQLGEYFGASLASCDIDGDDVDELLVGAPSWTAETQQIGKPDVGRVHAYKNYSDFSMVFWHDITGTTPGGRFGTVITCLKDVDGDGFQDVAVGAPYENNGTVYIFYGGPNGLSLEYSQKISSPKNVVGFGISISNAQDIDQNGFPDIAVGAYLSGHAVILRSKLIVELSISIKEPLIPSKPNFTSSYKSFTGEVCSKYHNVRPDSSLQQPLNLTHHLTIQGTTIIKIDLQPLMNTKKKGVRIDCQNFTITLKKTFGPNVTLTAKVSWPKNNDYKPWVISHNDTSGDDHFDENSMVVRERTSNLTTQPILLSVTDCQPVCKDSITVHLSADLGNASEPYIVGTRATLRLTVVVKNSGEEALGIRMIIRVPNPITFVENQLRDCIRCQHNAESDNCIDCLIDSVLPDNAQITANVNLNMSEIHGEGEFKVTTNTTTKGTSARGFARTLTFTSLIDIRMSLAGTSFPGIYSYVENSIKIISFYHVYKVRNTGMTPARTPVLTVWFPVKWKNAEIIKADLPPVCKESDEFSGSGQTYDDDWKLVMNCEHPSITCKRVDCTLEQVTHADANVHIRFEASTSDSPFWDKDSITFESNGTVTVTEGRRIYNESVKSSTILLRKDNSTQSISSTIMLIIAVSVLLGLLLLGLSVYVLHKRGFFKRNKRDEMKRLQNKEDVPIGNIEIDEMPSADKLGNEAIEEPEA